MNHLAIISVLASCYLIYKLIKPNPYKRYVCDNGIMFDSQDEDDDIKIATGHFSGGGVREDSADLAAENFLRQKNSGNIDHARSVGAYFAKLALSPQLGPLADELEGKSPLVQHHLYLLYSYIVNRVIAEHSPDSILAQTSLNVFYSNIEEASPELHKHVTDMAAFSLYILCERSPNRSEDELGQVFADLLDMEDNAQMVQLGNGFYKRMYQSCMQVIKDTPYSVI